LSFSYELVGLDGVAWFADEPGGGVDGGSPGGLLGIGVANSRILRVVRRFDGIRVDVLVGSVLAALLLVV